MGWGIITRAWFQAAMGSKIASDRSSIAAGVSLVCGFDFGLLIFFGVVKVCYSLGL
jgi:hypothetical protein